jgi:hypothetical protein
MLPFAIRAKRVQSPSIKSSKNAKKNIQQKYFGAPFSKYQGGASFTVRTFCQKKTLAEQAMDNFAPKIEKDPKILQEMLINNRYRGGPLKHGEEIFVDTVTGKQDSSTIELEHPNFKSWAHAMNGTKLLSP